MNCLLDNPNKHSDMENKPDLRITDFETLL